MEMSVQGKAAASDFSIERILSDTTRSPPRPAEVPSWLWCTRYRPPRLPRYGAGAAGRARRAGRHARVPFTAAQAQALEAAYARAPYLAPPALRALAAALQLRDDRIKIWFQNRRARERREKCGSIPPPNGVTLPPTLMPPHVARTDNPVGSDQHQVDQTLGNHRDGETRSGVLYVHYSNSCLEDVLSDGRPESPLDIESVED